MTLLRTLLLSVMALLLAAAALPAASANDNNAGTVKVHDNETENPEMRNVPHVSCDFWVQAFNMNDPSGYLVFYAWPPTGEKQVVTPTGADPTFNDTTADEKGNYDFNLGPFFLPAGHYRVEVYTDDGHPGGAEGHFAKTKTFWVEPCEEEFVNPPCPPGLTAVALDDAGVDLTWTAVADVDTYNVYRAVGEGDFEFLTSVETTSFTDRDVTGGVVYSYYVTAAVGDLESVGCEIVTVTAIPFFGAPVLVGLAAVGAVAAYAVLRRRT